MNNQARIVIESLGHSLVLGQVAIGRQICGVRRKSAGGVILNVYCVKENAIGARLGKIRAAAEDQDVLLVAKCGELAVVFGVRIEIGRAITDGQPFRDRLCRSRSASRLRRRPPRAQTARVIERGVETVEPIV